MIVCQRCGKISESMGEAPVMGRIGELVLNNTCKNCWEEWKKTEMITINEYRLDFSMKEHRDFFYSQMKQFLKLPDR